MELKSKRDFLHTPEEMLYDVHKMKEAGGLTLIELIVAIGIAAVLIVGGIGAYQLFFRRSLVDQAAMQLSQTLQEARDLSIGVRNGYEYGVRFHESEGSYDLVYVEGVTPVTSYSRQLRGRVYFDAVNLDETNIIYFSKLFGKPSQGGTITVSDGGINKTVKVTGSGIIQVN